MEAVILEVGGERGGKWGMREVKVLTALHEWLICLNICFCNCKYEQIPGAGGGEHSF